ncbi:hypothetical protein ACLB2K_015910 [Fragaria x ananassa]
MDDHDLRVPVIDLKGVDWSSERRKEIVDEITKAVETWGFFQIENHGIPMSVREEVLKGVRRFHEQSQEDKVECKFLEDRGELEAALPQVCRHRVLQFIQTETQLFGHYYPVCPEPDLTLGATKHSDFSFLTLLLQDSHGGLQVLHQDVWVDVPPVPHY